MNRLHSLAGVVVVEIEGGGGGTTRFPPFPFPNQARIEANEVLVRGQVIPTPPKKKGAISFPSLLCAQKMFVRGGGACAPTVCPRPHAPAVRHPPPPLHQHKGRTAACHGTYSHTSDK